MGKVPLLAMVALFCMGLAGCSAKTDVTYMAPEPTETQNSRTYKANIDQVWDAAIKSISKSFFVLDNIAKDSHIITLSFAANDPRDFIDCGKTTRVTTHHGTTETYSYDAAISQATYKQAKPNADPMPIDVLRTTRLEGKANIVFEPEGKETRVTINTRYIFSITLSGTEYVTVGYTTFPRSFSLPASPVAFNGGQTGTTGDGMRCVSNFTLEKTILDDIGSAIK